MRMIRQLRQEGKALQGTRSSAAMVPPTVDARVEAIQALIPLGLAAVAAELEAEVTRLAGPLEMTPDRFLRMLAATVAITGCSPAPVGVGRAVPPNQEWCATPTSVIDSAFAVRQAVQILHEPRSILSLEPRSVHVVEEGFLVSLVVAQPRGTRGGGGLVWVDFETGCPIVLRRYE